MKALYALVFVLFSFAAPAQALETWIAAYYLDDLDCFGETTQQSTMPPQIIGIELLCAAMLNDADGVAITGSNGAEDVPVGAIQPSDENEVAAYSNRSDDLPTVGDTSEQSLMPTQIIATEPTIETLGEAKLNDADDPAITGPNGAEDVPVGAIQPSDENSTAIYSTARDDTLTVDDTMTLGEAKADDVAITGPNGAEDVPVGAIQPSNEDSMAANWSRSDDQSAVDDTIE